MKMQLVKEWMTPDPVCVPPTCTVPEALKLMKDRHIRRLPVVEKGALLGIVTYGDLREVQPSPATTLSIYELNYLLNQLTVEKVMTRRVFTVTPQTTIGDAARLMLRNTIAGLPVMVAGHVVGILTESDIFRLVVKTWEQADELVPA
jgi:CBS domain-containing protein